MPFLKVLWCKCGSFLLETTFAQRDEDKDNKQPENLIAAILLGEGIKRLLKQVNAPNQCELWYKTKQQSFLAVASSMKTFDK